MSSADKINVFCELISCNYNIALSIYDHDMNLISVADHDALLFDSLLTASKNKQFLATYEHTSHKPAVLSDEFGLVWIACFGQDDSGRLRSYVLGPVYTNENSLKNLRVKLDHYDISLKAKRKLLEKLKDIPVIMSNIFFQYAIMLHYCLTGQKIQYSDIQYKSHAEMPGTQLPLETASRHHGIWAAEQRLFAMVEQGVLDYQEALSDVASLSHGIKFDVGNSVRQAQVSVHSFITLCCRAAIRGGMSSETAYTLADYYAQAVESTSNLSEIGILSHTMYEDYIQRVHKLKSNPSLSLPIQTCCDYIELHLSEKISIGALAKLVGYTEYYLSRKFKKETGESISLFIQKCRIERAKLTLATTKKSIQEISDDLAFCSRSYFSDVFHRITGLSPQQYREEHRRI